MTSDNKPALLLLVEDEALVRMLAWDTLTEEGGYRVLEAPNAEEALTLLEARPDIRGMFTDVNMPGSLDGYALARLVDMRWPGIGVIVTSGGTYPKPGDLPKKARFIAKPYPPSARLKEVREVLGEAAPIVLPLKGASPGSASVLPAAIKLDQPHTGIGTAGGLAQPLAEPED